ncbi:MAG: hypothetical protein QM529_02730 [Hydrotalea sp.]|nr:hypothetical protein [Hydrotalea sp.]
MKQTIQPNTAILLAIAPAVFLGSDTLFEQLERVVLTPDNLFDAPLDNLFAGDVLDKFIKKTAAPDNGAQFPLPSFYDFLTLSLSHLPYLAPQQLVALPQRFPLPPITQDKATSRNNKKKYHLLPFQESLITRWLTPHPAVNKFLIIMMAGLIIRAFTAIDPKSIIDAKPRAAVTQWRRQAIEQLRRVVQQRIAMPHQYLLFGRAHQIYHLTALHQQLALTNLDNYDRIEESLAASHGRKLSPQKIKNLLPHRLPGSFWLQKKRIHYHLLELQTLPRQLCLPLPSPFLTLVNLASLTHWLINDTGEVPEQIVQDTIDDWRQELLTAIDEKNQTRLYDHYPVYGEVLEKIDGQLKSIKTIKIKKSKAGAPNSPPRDKTNNDKTIHPLTLKDNRFILSLAGANAIKHKKEITHNPLNLITYFLGFFTTPPSPSSYILPWQKSAFALPTIIGGKQALASNISNHLMMTFDVIFKKKSFIESGVWLSPEPHKKRLSALLALLPKIGAKNWTSNLAKNILRKPRPSHYYIDNSLQLGGSPLAQPTSQATGQPTARPTLQRTTASASYLLPRRMTLRNLTNPINPLNPGAWRYIRCQKFLLPAGDMLYSKKILNLPRRHGNRTISIERQLFMPRHNRDADSSYGGEKKPQIYLKAQEKIIAPGGIDFMLLLPLSPSIKAFGRSDSLIHELEQHWQRPMKKNDLRPHGGGIIEPLIPHDNPDDNLKDKIESLQEVFLQSPDKPGGRLVSRGATLSLTKGVFLNDFMEEPCQVIMLSGQTTPGETIINWVLELVA